MAVFTTLESLDIQTILNSYKIGELEQFSGISEGVENTNYLITTNSGKYILTIFEKRVNQRDLPFFLELMFHLSNNNFPAPKIILNQNEQMTFRFKAKTGVIISFLNGKSVEDNFTNSHLELLGEKLANMHNITENFNKKRDNNFSPIGIKKLFFELNRKKLIEAEKANIITEQLNKFEQLDLSELKKGIIHADLFPDNVFFEAEKITGVIDFYFACYDYLIFDLATCINAWCFDANGNFNQSLSESLIRSYSKTNPLSDNEKQLLKNFCVLTAIRFYLTRLHDKYYHTPDNQVTQKKPEEFFKKIQYFAN